MKLTCISMDPRVGTAHRLATLVVALVVALSAGAMTTRADAQAPPRTPPDDRGTPTGTARPAPPSDERILDAFGQRDYEEALRLIRLALQTRAHDFVLHYNGACALALLGRNDEAIDWLREAIRRGFRDFDLMIEDPDLESLRGDPRFVELAQGRREPRVPASRQAEQQLEEWRRRFGAERYHYDFCADLNVHFAIALDEDARERMRTMLLRQGRQQMEALFGAKPADPVFVAIPRPADARIFFRELGERDAVLDSPNIAGIYEHRPRRLVSTDIGASLRHEFTHAMHYGHMERLRQPHPLWIQEGLATLYEDYDLRDDGTIVFLPNQRHNTIRSLVRAGRAMKWREMAEIDAKDFMDRAQQLYPQVRSIFEYLAELGLLERWYRAYTDGFVRDRSGVAAFEEVFGTSLETVEHQWRQWVVRRPPVQTVVRTGGASLGVEVDDTNDGARILRVIPGGAAARAGLQRGDVIVNVDDRAVASATELVAVIAGRRVGETVRLRIRRDGAYLDGTARLEPLRPDR